MQGNIHRLLGEQGGPSRSMAMEFFRVGLGRAGESEPLAELLEGFATGFWELGSSSSNPLFFRLELLLVG